MDSLNLNPQVITSIIDDPTILAPNSGTTRTLGPNIRENILAGYIKGFRTLFILNASFSALATIAGIFLIKHHELTRPDEARLREEARLAEKKKSVEEIALRDPAQRSEMT